MSDDSLFVLIILGGFLLAGLISAVTPQAFEKRRLRKELARLRAANKQAREMCDRVDLEEARRADVVPEHCTKVSDRMSARITIVAPPKKP